jgi:hypothetical protein
MPEWIVRYVGRVEDELFEIVRNVPRWPLKSIDIDAPFAVESSGSRFFTIMSALCQQRNVRYNKPEDCWFSEDSRKSHFARMTHDISELDDNKVTPVRRTRTSNTRQAQGDNTSSKCICSMFHISSCIGGFLTFMIPNSAGAVA